VGRTELLELNPEVALPALDMGVGTSFFGGFEALLLDNLFFIG